MDEVELVTHACLVCVSTESMQSGGGVSGLGLPRDDDGGGELDDDIAAHLRARQRAIAEGNTRTGPLTESHTVTPHITHSCLWGQKACWMMTMTTKLVSSHPLCNSPLAPTLVSLTYN